MGDATATIVEMGGLVGYLKRGTITKCYSTGNILANNGGESGGLVGNILAGTITKSYSTSTIATGTSSFVGGLVGNVYTATITDVYARGNVTGNQWAGGLIGYLGGGATFSNGYSTGTVVGGNPSGGLLGDIGATAHSSFWLTGTAAGTTGESGGTVATAAEMTTTDTGGVNGIIDIYENAGWDGTTIWDLTPGAYPTLRP